MDNQGFANGYLLDGIFLLFMIPFSYIPYFSIQLCG